MVERLEELFPKVRRVTRFLGLVITKCLYRELNENDYYRLMYYLLKEVDENRIFLFPEPESGDRIYDTERTDLQKLMRFVRNNDGCLDNPEVHISLNEKLKAMVERDVWRQINENSMLLEETFKVLRCEYEKRIEDEESIP